MSDQYRLFEIERVEQKNDIRGKSSTRYPVAGLSESPCPRCDTAMVLIPRGIRSRTGSYDLQESVGPGNSTTGGPDDAPCSAVESVSPLGSVTDASLVTIDEGY